MLSGNSFLFRINNTSRDEIPAAVTAALYRGGALVGISSREMTISEGVSTESSRIPNTGYDRIKILVWESASSLTPLYSAFEF
ncbi:MAG: hypothetical protein SO147_01745 [Clostridia bacterium]|nr:hypothetical protein [Clostridia bacterium]